MDAISPTFNDRREFYLKAMSTIDNIRCKSISDDKNKCLKFVKKPPEKNYYYNNLFFQNYEEPQKRAKVYNYLDYYNMKRKELEKVNKPNPVKLKPLEILNTAHSPKNTLNDIITPQSNILPPLSTQQDTNLFSERSILNENLHKSYRSRFKTLHNNFSTKNLKGNQSLNSLGVTTVATQTNSMLPALNDNHSHSKINLSNISSFYNDSIVNSSSVRNLNAINLSNLNSSNMNISQMNVSKLIESKMTLTQPLNRVTTKKEKCHSKCMTFDQSTVYNALVGKNNSQEKKKSSEKDQPVKKHFVLRYMLDELKILNGKILQLPSKTPPPNEYKQKQNKFIIFLDDYEENLINLKYYKEIMGKSAKIMISSSFKGEDKETFLKKHKKQLGKTKVNHHFDKILNHLYRSVKYYNDKNMNLGGELVLNLIKNEVKAITKGIETLVKASPKKLSKIKKLIKQKEIYSRDNLLNYHNRKFYPTSKLKSFPTNMYNKKFYSTSKLKSFPTNMYNKKMKFTFDEVPEEENEEIMPKKVKIFSKSLGNFRTNLSPICENYEDDSDIINNSLTKNLLGNDEKRKMRLTKLKLKNDASKSVDSDRSSKSRKKEKKDKKRLKNTNTHFFNEAENDLILDTSFSRNSRENDDTLIKSNQNFNKKKFKDVKDVDEIKKRGSNSLFSDSCKSDNSEGKKIKRSSNKKGSLKSYKSNKSLTRKRKKNKKKSIRRKSIKKTGGGQNASSVENDGSSNINNEEKVNSNSNAKNKNTEKVKRKEDLKKEASNNKVDKFIQKESNKVKDGGIDNEINIDNNIKKESSKKVQKQKKLKHSSQEKIKGTTGYQKMSIKEESGNNASDSEKEVNKTKVNEKSKAKDKEKGKNKVKDNSKSVNDTKSKADIDNSQKTNNKIEEKKRLLDLKAEKQKQKALEKEMERERKKEESLTKKQKKKEEKEMKLIRTKEKQILKEREKEDKKKRKKYEKAEKIEKLNVSNNSDNSNKEKEKVEEEILKKQIEFFIYDFIYDLVDQIEIKEEYPQDEIKHMVNNEEGNTEHRNPMKGLCEKLCEKCKKFLESREENLFEINYENFEYECELDTDFLRIDREERLKKREEIRRLYEEEERRSELEEEERIERIKQEQQEQKRIKQEQKQEQKQEEIKKEKEDDERERQEELAKLRAETPKVQNEDKKLEGGQDKDKTINNESKNNERLLVNNTNKIPKKEKKTKEEKLKEQSIRAKRKMMMDEQIRKNQQLLKSKLNSMGGNTFGYDKVNFDNENPNQSLFNNPFEEEKFATMHECENQDNELNEEFKQKQNKMIIFNIEQDLTFQLSKSDITPEEKKKLEEIKEKILSMKNELSTKLTTFDLNFRDMKEEFEVLKGVKEKEERLNRFYSDLNSYRRSNLEIRDFKKKIKVEENVNGNLRLKPIKQEEKFESKMYYEDNVVDTEEEILINKKNNKKRNKLKNNKKFIKDESSGSSNISY